MGAINSSVNVFDDREIGVDEAEEDHDFAEKNGIRKRSTV